MRLPEAEPNDTRRAGQRASESVLFGPFRRYSLCAVHSRYGSMWIVSDAEQADDVTGAPAVVRQSFDCVDACRWLDELGRDEPGADDA